MCHLPLVSIIMPIRNEAGFIQRSVATILAQDYPQEQLEILIVDGMSHDGTRAIIGQLQQRCSRLQLIDNPRHSAAAALNVGLQRARGEIIIRVDGHCELDPAYVRMCVQHLQDDGVEGVGGPIETLGLTQYATPIALAMSSAFGVGGAAFRTINNRKLLVDTVAFPAYTRQALALAGPFDEELIRNQDDEFNYRLRKLGGRILLAPTVRARYYCRSSLRALARQYFGYGFWKVRVLQKHPRQMRPRQFVPPAFVALLLCMLLLSSSWTAGRLLLGMLLGSYSLATLLAALWIARRYGWQHLPFLPAVFATLHFSYGLGFLAGLLRFAHRWRQP